MSRLCSSRFERAARKLGWTRIAGLDEAGRGALFRPVVAASILANTHRDARMEEWDAVYPQYGLARHKGYATADHLEALRQHGPTPLHRYSFAPVRDAGCWSAGAIQIALLPDAILP